MAELLLELFSEEIPARMQAKAAHDLLVGIDNLLGDAGIIFDPLKCDEYWGPRRIVAHYKNLEIKGEDVSEERRGPKIDAPEKAIEGFLKSAGVARDDCEEREEKKGTFLYANIEKLGQPSSVELSAKLPELIRNFSWPKSQRWGDGDLRWVRPLQSILCLLDGKIVPFEVDGIVSGNVTRGHRFMAPGEITVKDFADYETKLAAAKVKNLAEQRALDILTGAKALAKNAKLELIEDKDLLREVTGLVEWPVPLIASFDESFLDLPSEVLVSEMRHHQKYFALNDPKSGKLANKFIVVANIEGADEAIISGNERVLAARLSDARFFWDQDRKTALEDNLPRLEDIVFHAKLGTVGDRARRMAALAAEIAKFFPASGPDCDSGSAERAAMLAKADLVSGMVGEFPDLQGVMGGYYAADQGEPEAVSTAIAEHYAPQGPKDTCPTASVSVAVALAEKLDTLVGFFGIEERPTGSKDPYALRRAALGVIRLITENNLRLPLRTIVTVAENGYLEQIIASGDKSRAFTLRVDQLWDEIIAFIADRLKVQTRERGIRHDLIDAVFSAGDEAEAEEDIVRLLTRVEALQGFLGTEDGENLLAGFTRAANIVRIEEKKDGKSYADEVDPVKLILDEEKTLFKALLMARKTADEAVAHERFEDAMAAIAALRAPIDTFFDKVTVNTDDPGLRSNRLRLLSQIRASLNAVANFSRIEGQ